MTRRLASLLLAFAFAAPLGAAPVPVELRSPVPGRYTLLRGGEPYFVRGAGAADRLDRLAACGANSVRTWGSEQTERLLDEADRLGLTVCAGLWIDHERHGFDYDDAARVQAQIEKHCRDVDRLKDHPALLLWAVGNEVETGATHPGVWDAIEAVAAYIKRVDPHHPVMTVMAHANPAAIAEINRRCPSIDLIGCNCYAGIAVIARDVRAAGWRGPYLVTEWGNNGYWEVPKTAWGAEIEPTSTEKAAQRRARYALLRADTERCLGGYAFFWGQKQEITPSWFSLFGEDGEETESVEELQSLWTGREPAGLAPRVSPLRLNGAEPAAGLRVAPGAGVEARSTLLRGDAAAVRVQWELLHETTAAHAGGDAEARPPAEPLDGRAGVSGGVLHLAFPAPTRPGAYRLFLSVHGAQRTLATANFPFLVEAR